MTCSGGCPLAAWAAVALALTAATAQARPGAEQDSADRDGMAQGEAAASAEAAPTARPLRPPGSFDHFWRLHLVGTIDLGFVNYERDRLGTDSSTVDDSTGTLGVDTRLEYSQFPWLKFGLRLGARRFFLELNNDPIPEQVFDLGGVVVVASPPVHGWLAYAGAIGGAAWFPDLSETELYVKTTADRSLGSHLGLLAGLRFHLVSMVALVAEVHAIRYQWNETRTIETTSGAPVDEPLRHTDTGARSMLLSTLAVGAAVTLY